MFFSLPSVTRQTKLSCPQLNEQHGKQSKKRKVKKDVDIKVEKNGIMLPGGSG